jgi:hypothetical protein
MDPDWWHVLAPIALLGVGVTGFIWAAALRGDRRRRKRRLRYRRRALQGIGSSVNDPVRGYEAEAGREQEAEGPKSGDACPAGRWGILRDGVVVETYASEEMARRRFLTLIQSQADAMLDGKRVRPIGRKLRSVFFVIPPR